MSTEYAGNNIYPATVTVLEDLDLKNAASIAVGLQQLADRTAFLNALITGGEDLEFTDATFHGTTTFADGDIVATVDSVSLAATTGILFLGGNSIELGATTTIELTAVGDVTIDTDGDVRIPLASAKALIINGGAGSAVDFYSGKVTIPATGDILLAASVVLGAGGGDTVTVTANMFDLGATDFDFSDSNCNGSFGGAVTFTATSAVEHQGSCWVTGRFRLLTTTPSNADFAVSGALGESYEFVLLDNPGGGGRTITLTHAALSGQRMRFNAQNVITGADDWQLVYGSQTWNMRNASGKTVVIEFVSSGGAWVVDDWAEGGGMRNG